MGGEPVKAVLFKNRMKVRGRVAVSSILLENSLGMSIDTLFIGGMVIFTFVFFTLPDEFAFPALLVSVAGMVVAMVYFYTLIDRKGPFSSVFRLFYKVVKRPFIKDLINNIKKVEEVMAVFLRSRKKGVFEAIAISSISWPLTFMQYKLALLSVGYDASMSIILLSIIATNVATYFPIPGAFGVQEAGHFSVFSLVGAANVGIALSLLIRFKDLILTFLGLTLLSHEGLDIVDVLRKNNSKKLR